MDTVMVERLIEQLRHPDARQREDAARKLGLLFRPSNDPPLDLDELRRGMVALQAAITDTDAEVRTAIAEALGRTIVVARDPSADWRHNWQPPSGYPRTGHPRDRAE